MDKILFSTFFALMAGCIAAAMSFVKLVNDKENRITDYREEWTNSVRKTLADVVAHINTISSLTEKRVNVSEILNDLSNKIANEKGTAAHQKITQQQLDHYKSYLENIKLEIITVQKEMNQTYNFARLHFKQDDCAFSIIESKFDNIRALINDLSTSNIEKEKVSRIQGKMDIYANDIIVASRGIMKIEWERIKQGELVYQKTKSAAKWGGVILFFVLFTVGIHAAISAYLNHPPVVPMPHQERLLSNKSTPPLSNNDIKIKTD